MSIYKEETFITRDELAHIVKACHLHDSDYDKFYDIFENDSAKPRFDCLCSVTECIGNAECYIVDRETGHYINWYKLYHIGRDFTTNMSSKEEIEQFFKAFYEEAEKEWNK